MAPPQPKSRGGRVPQSTRKPQETPKSQVGHEQVKPCELPSELQQCILNVFKIAFPVFHDLTALKATIQEVKGHLYHRDFEAAFGQQSYLEAYALRWSAARALGYAALFTVPNRLRWLENVSVKSGSMRTAEEMSADPIWSDGPARVVCIGGGAGAEVVALAAAATQTSDPSHALQITAVDVADWASITDRLSQALSQTPPTHHSGQAADQKRAELRPLLTDANQVKVSFCRQDVLSWADDDLRDCLGNADLCTILFTLNELFTASLPKATSFLLRMTHAMPTDSRFVVVDSPGSYSEISLGKDGTPNKYPMKWLLDHTLLDVAGRDENSKWVKEEEHDSVWHRIDQSKVQYPIDLENMRCQIHVYRKL